MPNPSLPPGPFLPHLWGCQTAPATQGNASALQVQVWQASASLTPGAPRQRIFQHCLPSSAFGSRRCQVNGRSGGAVPRQVGTSRGRAGGLGGGALGQLDQGGKQGERPMHPPCMPGAFQRVPAARDPAGILVGVSEGAQVGGHQSYPGGQNSRYFESFGADP